MAACSLVAGRPVPGLSVAATAVFDVADRPTGVLAVKGVVSGVAFVATAFLRTAGAAPVSAIASAKGSVVVASVIELGAGAAEAMEAAT